MWRRLLFVLALVVLVAVTDPAGATFPGEPGRLALLLGDRVTWQSGAYSILPDGSGLDLVRSPATQPVWSPRSRHLAVIQTDDHRTFVEVTDIRTGSSFVAFEVTAPQSISSMAWSPNARWLAIGIDQQAGFGDVVLVPLSGDGQQHVAAFTQGGIGPSLDWSPRGDLLAVTLLSTEGASVIATLSLDGSDITVLADGTHPSWSPDASEIVFVGPLGTSVIGADGSGLRVVPGLELGQPPGPQLGVGFSPVWSPAGDEIAVVGFQGVHALIVDAMTGEAETLFSDFDRPVYDIDWAVATDGSTFADVPFTHRFSSDVEWLFDSAITRGCNPPLADLFCVRAPATRGQLAAFVARTFDLSPAGDINPFIDDEGSVFEDDIGALASAGITFGCNPPDNDRFCPGEPATRGHVAALLVRALGLDPLTGVDTFIDDDGSVFEADIEALAAAGITGGCDAAGVRFCPRDPVTRGQIAAFLHRARGDRCDLLGACG